MVAAEDSTTIVCPDLQRSSKVLKDERGTYCEACGRDTYSDGKHFGGFA